MGDLTQISSNDNLRDSSPEDMIFSYKVTRSRQISSVGGACDQPRWMVGNGSSLN